MNLNNKHMKNILPKTLIIISTHGNELIGLEVVSKLIKKGFGDKFDFIIANPFALNKNTRALKKDMNRIYPGNARSTWGEERLAAKNLKVAKRYKYVIDMHEASEGTNDFIIIPRKEIGDLCPINLISLSTLLLWPDPKGPLSSILPNAFELEFGMKGKDRKKIIKKATKIVAEFLQSVERQKTTSIKQKRIFYVYGKLLKQELPSSNEFIKNLKDFKKTLLFEEQFYPLLVGQYAKDNIICYKMRKLK